MKMMEQIITFKVLLLQPTPAVIFGLQKGSGNDYETIQKQQAYSEDLSFHFSIRIKGDRNQDEFPKFSGEFVQGPAGNKFIYLDIGTYAGQQESPWSRRLKIPLTITWENIDQLAVSTDSFMETQVPGTRKDGSPNCATVKPFSGWQVKTD